MAKAKGVLPYDEAGEVLKSPEAGGFFVTIQLDPAADAAAWLAAVEGPIGALVVREDPVGGNPKGRKVAVVAVGLAPSFFQRPGIVGVVESPAGLSGAVPLPNSMPPLNTVAAVEADVLLYVASTQEARVNDFLSALAAIPGTLAVRSDRGYQRRDHTEPFGYRDGVRNPRVRADRERIAFVDRDGAHPEEPEWADGGSYLTYMKIRQDPTVFAQLDETSRDTVIGRTKAGRRLDVADASVKARDEPADTSQLPPTSHVRKTGPRGTHDAVQIFRRGLPYVETTADGRVAVGLQFCSFQATLEQFDVVFNDWAMNTVFPPEAGQPGRDRLLDPATGLTAFEKVGFFFVPPHHPKGLAAAVLASAADRKPGPPTTGRLVIRKRIVDGTGADRRFERAGFRFEIVRGDGPLVAEVETDLTGRAICPQELPIGETATVHEIFSPLTGVPVAPAQIVTVDRPNVSVVFTNTAASETPYGATPTASPVA